VGDRLEVVAPDPAAEVEVAVVGALARQPCDRVRRLEDLDAVGDLVVHSPVVRVIHRHPKDLADVGQPLAVERLPHPAGAVDRLMGVRVGQHVEPAVPYPR